MAKAKSKTDKKPTHAVKSTQSTQKLDSAAKAPAEPTNRPKGLTVVGIGASAGGLAALRSFFEALPSNTDMAFVVITHLHPEHESHMAELLQRSTQMPTTQVVKKTRVEPNHVYVIPPNRSIIMADSHVETMEFTEPHGRRTPIDHFFRSLASGHSESIAVILSGGGTDGSVGIKDIKEQGGLILVQHPEDAEYDSMPRAVISTGLADVILPAHELARKLVDYIKHRPQLLHDAGQLSEKEAETLHRILAQVHARTGHDFNHYKRSIILRRVERRMQLNGFDTLEAYLNFLRHNANEAVSMFNDILIGVTNFFRDRESWNVLAEKVVPALFEKKEGEDGIRVWSIGCATGEEAYGLAILLFEQAARLEIRPRIQIFASDLDESSIAQAREGLYPAAIEADVSPERLERYFTREGQYFRIRRELRDAVLFTNHNVLRDPPFSRQDLIACRNVLIYLQREIQDNVFDIFHYALNPGGHLFLGTSESVEHLPDLFNVVDKTHRIYQARPWAGDKLHMPSMPLNLRSGRAASERYSVSRSRMNRYTAEEVPLEEHRRALEMYAPPSVLINERSMVLHVSESAGRYLLQPKGPITGDLLKLVRPELQLELRTTIFHAFERDRATFSHPVLVQFNGHARRVILAVRPRLETTQQGRAQERQALVVFLEDELEERPETLEVQIQPPRAGIERDQVIAQLEAEVQRLREQLQVTIEEYDNSNEEMKAANEELQSINEEYRSATEELETSKEELQSVNEELQTVNSDMRNKLDEISRAHEELENLLGATEIGTLFLDRELRIQWFTAGVNALINLMPGDRGRPIGHLTHKLKYDQFTEDAEQVLRRLTPLEHEVQTENDDWYLLRFRPFRTTEDRIVGVVITFIDITKLKKAEQDLLRAKEMLEERVVERTLELDEANQKMAQARDMFKTLFRANPIPTTLNRLEDGTFVDVNEAYLEFFGIDREALIGHTSVELNLVASAEERSRIMARMKEQGSIHNVETQVKTGAGETKTILVSSQKVNIDRSDVMLSAFIDITARKQIEENLGALLDAAPDPTVMVNEAGEILRINTQLERAFGYSRDDLLGQPVEKLLPARFHANHPIHRALFMKEPRTRPMGSGLSLSAQRSDGTEFPVEVSLSPLETEAGILVIASIRDITERQKADQQIRALATQLTEAEQEERHRISEILHDDLQQRLFAVKAQLRMVDEAYKKQDAEGLQNLITEMDGWLAEAISVMRNLSIEISPIILHGEGLTDAIAWLSTQMRRQYHLEVILHTDGVKTSFDKALRVMLFQAVRELLFNVVKHSETLQAVVSMENVDGRVRITVADQGKGFDPARVLNGAGIAQGLMSISHRLDLLGCYMDVQSRPGAGARITIDCPEPGAEEIS
ncbi:MAG: CheR family methyltransferase [Chloroflexota bacterium]